MSKTINLFEQFNSTHILSKKELLECFDDVIVHYQNSTALDSETREELLRVCKLMREEIKNSPVEPIRSPLCCYSIRLSSDGIRLFLCKYHKYALIDSANGTPPLEAYIMLHNMLPSLGNATEVKRYQ